MMLMNKSFCIFIISHGRPDKVITLRTLKKCGYTGPLFIVCDNEDKTVDQYRANYGAGKIIVFDKLAYAQKVDNCDNFQNRRTTTHARNACFDIAAEKGFEFFLVLDDDYKSFCQILPTSKNTTDTKVRNFDVLSKIVINFLSCDERLKSVCFLQSGDTIGGMVNYNTWQSVFPFSKRKAMNSFFCKTSRRFWFFSRLNEDVNTYLALGSLGYLFMTIPQILLQQEQTQKTAGGMSDAYLASGTYVKTFYTVMIGPSYCKATVTSAMKRIHHKISWNNAIPKILDPEHKK